MFFSVLQCLCVRGALQWDQRVQYSPAAGDIVAGTVSAYSRAWENENKLGSVVNMWRVIADVHK